MIWASNVIAFGLWYWDLDRGGAAARTFEDDGVAECFELAGVVTVAAFGVGAGGVEPGTEIVERASGPDSRW